MTTTIRYGLRDPETGNLVQVKCANNYIIDEPVYRLTAKGDHDFTVDTPEKLVSLMLEAPLDVTCTADRPMWGDYDPNLLHPVKLTTTTTVEAISIRKPMVLTGRDFVHRRKYPAILARKIRPDLPDTTYEWILCHHDQATMEAQYHQIVVIGIFKTAYRVMAVSAPPEEFLPESPNGCVVILKDERAAMFG